MGKRILLTGFSGQSREWALEQPKTVEIWGLNESHNCTSWLNTRDDLGRESKIRCACYNPNACKCLNHEHAFIPRYDRWFQIHPPNWKETERIKKAATTGDRIHERDLDTFGRNERHIKFLRECDTPVYMLRLASKWGPFPNAVRYPFGKVEKALGMQWGRRKNLYVTSSPAYMLALALYEHLEGDTLSEIRLAGIELSVGTEYFHQRPCFEFYLGMARGMGIRVTRPPMGSSLLASPRYAIDAPIAPPDGFSFEPLPLRMPNNEQIEALMADVEMAEPEEVAVAD
jgi:hypothetical protein